jgi:hypothetical protein
MSMTDPTTLALVLMAFGLVSAVIAVSKGRSFLLFGLLGMLVPITVVYAIFMHRKDPLPGLRRNNLAHGAPLPALLDAFILRPAAQFPAHPCIRD